MTRLSVRHITKDYSHVIKKTRGQNNCFVFHMELIEKNLSIPGQELSF